MGGRILVGRFGAPHGIRGEVRLMSFTQVPSAIATYGPLHDERGTRAFEIKALRAVKDNMFVARVAGLADRSAAEAVTNLDLYIARDVLPPADADEFYLADLIGVAAFDEAGSLYGTVVAVPNYGAGDILEIAPAAGGENLLFPFTKAVVPTVDLAGRRLTLIPPDETVDPAERSDPR